MKTIIEMAKECGVHEYGPLTRNWSFELSQLERFAALVRADEQIKALEAARTIGGDWAAKFEQEYLK
jgi:hypothetical protein